MSPAARKRISAAMKQRWAKWKGKSAPKKTQSPSCNERRRQEEVIGTDESPLGCEEKGEGIVKALNSDARQSRLASRDDDHSRLRVGGGRYHHLVSGISWGVINDVFLIRRETRRWRYE